MELLLVLVLLLLSPVLFKLARAMFGSGVTIDEMLQRPDLAWPRGVQEEEPVAWRLDRLAPARRRATRLGDLTARDVKPRLAARADPRRAVR